MFNSGLPTKLLEEKYFTFTFEANGLLVVVGLSNDGSALPWIAELNLLIVCQSICNPALNHTFRATKKGKNQCSQEIQKHPRDDDLASICSELCLPSLRDSSDPSPSQHGEAQFWNPLQNYAHLLSSVERLNVHGALNSVVIIGRPQSRHTLTKVGNWVKRCLFKPPTLIVSYVLHQ